jgi:hypothetical protein
MMDDLEARYVPIARCSSRVFFGVLQRTDDESSQSSSLDIISLHFITLCVLSEPQNKDWVKCDH